LSKHFIITYEISQNHFVYTATINTLSMQRQSVS